MTWLIGLLGKVPGALVTRLAIAGLLLSVGIGIGQHWANQAAIKIVNDVRAEEFRKATWQLAKAQNEFTKRLEQERATQAAADAVAFKVYQDGIRAATNAAKRAENELANLRSDNLKLKDTTDGLKKVNEILASEIKPADPGCVLSPGVRVALDDYIASINNHPTVGDSQAAPASLPYGSAAAAPILTCSDLAASVTDILEHDAMLTAWVLSFQAWEVEIAR